MTIAKIILSQLKAIDARAMWAWGAKDLVDVGNGLQFKTSGMTPWKGFVKITLNQGADLYNIEFLRMRKIKGVPTVITDKKVEDIYAEDMVNIIDGFVG